MGSEDGPYDLDTFLSDIIYVPLVITANFESGSWEDFVAGRSVSIRAHPVAKQEYIDQINPALERWMDTDFNDRQSGFKNSESIHIEPIVKLLDHDNFLNFNGTMRDFKIIGPSSMIDISILHLYKYIQK